MTIFRQTTAKYAFTYRAALREYSPTDTANTLKVLLFDGKKQILQTHSIDIESAHKKLGTVQ